MLFKTILPGVPRAAALSPIQRKVFDLLQCEPSGHAVKTFKEFKHVFAGLKVRGQRLSDALPRLGYRRA